MSSDRETTVDHLGFRDQEDDLKEISTGFLIYSASLSLKKHFSQALSASGYQVSTEQYTVLSKLWQEDDIPQSILAKRICKDRHNVSRIIKSLERKALVTKKPDAADARLSRCILTDEGRALCDPLCRISEQVLEKAFQGTKEKDIQLLKKNLIHLLQNLGEDLFPPETDV